MEKTILPSSNKPASQEQVAAFLVVANHYDLSPFIKEIFAFPSQSGGIQPIVSVDGWLTLINRQPNLDGIKYEDHFDGAGKLSAITCLIYRKDRTYPNEITEYMTECYRDTPTWKKYPARMLRHKALIQCARQAFGFAGIYDPDEAERIAEAEGNGNGHSQSIADRTRERVDEMKAKYTPDATVDAEIVEPEPIIVIDEAPADDVIDVTDLEEEMDDSQLIDLRTAVKDLLAEKIGGMPSDQKKVLKGRVIENEDAETLIEMLKDLEAI